MGAVLLGISALWLLALAGELLFFEHQSRSYKFVTAFEPPLAVDESRGVDASPAPRVPSVRVVH